MIQSEQKNKNSNGQSCCHIIWQHELVYISLKYDTLTIEDAYKHIPIASLGNRWAIILGDSAKVIYYHYQPTKQRKEDGFPAVNDIVQREFKNDEREHNKMCIVATVRLAAT